MEESITRFIEAINLRDGARLEGLFAEALRYESQMVLEPLLGRRAVLEHLRGKLDTLRHDPADTWVEAGQLGTRPCGIIHQDGEPVALYLFEIDQAGQISAVDVTVAPGPSDAWGSGEYPGIGSPPAPSVLDLPERIPRDSLIVAHAFLLDPDWQRRKTERALREITGEYPNTETRIHILPVDAPFDSEEREAHSALVRRFGAISYPCVGVEGRGQVLMCFHPGHVTEARKHLRTRFTPPPHVLDAVTRFSAETFPDGRPVCVDRFEDEHAFLSNYFPCVLHFEGGVYFSVEAAFQAAKSTDPDLRRPFAEYSPDEAKRAGRRLPLRPDWTDIRVGVMRTLLRSKFSRPRLRTQLLATGDAVLVEGNWWGDRYWGVSGDQGENRLGRLLMEVRGELREQ